jgi:hypothetical protein
MKRATVGKSAEIDDAATLIFCKALPAAWPRRKQDPDYHFDYVVELVEAGELTGKNFGAQVKGYRPTPGKPVQLKRSLRAKHLAYYLDKVEFPVFLILVNTEEETTFYRFMQEFARGLPSGWRSQRTLTVEFDPADSFSDFLRFQNALVAASNFTRELHPGSVESALFKLAKDVERVDPRVAVRVDVIDQKKHFFLTPKENHTFSICLKNPTPENNAAFLNFVEKGTDLVVKAEDVKFENAPIFEKMTQGEIRVTHRAEMAGFISLSSLPGEEPFQAMVPAVFWQGTKYVSVQAVLKDSPFQFGTEFQPDLWNKGHSFTCSLQIDWEKWRGKPVQSLAFFDVAYELIGIFAEKRNIRAKFVIDGNTYGQGTFEDSDRTAFKKLFRLVGGIKKMRAITSKVPSFPKVPPLDKIDLDELSVIDQLHAVLFGGVFFSKIPHARVGIKLENDGGTIQPPETISPFAVSYPEPHFDIWDGKLSPGPLEYTYTAMRLETFKRRKNTLEVSWLGTPDSTITVERPKAKSG